MVSRRVGVASRLLVGGAALAALTGVAGAGAAVAVLEASGPAALLAGAAALAGASTAVWLHAAVRGRLVRAQTVAAEKTEQLAAVFDALPTGIGLFDADFRLVIHNRRYRDLWDYPPALLAGRPTVPDLMRFCAERGDYGDYDDIEDEIRRVIGTLRRGEPVDFELALAHGPVLAVRGNGMPGGAGYVYTYADVTESRRAEFALRESRERLNLAVMATHAAVWDENLAEGTAWWSPEYPRLLGYEPEEVAPEAGLWKRFVHPDDLPVVAAQADACVAGARDHYQATYRLRHKLGRWVWVEDYGCVLRGRGGRAVRFVGIMLDVTERMAAEEALRTAKEQAEAAAHAKSTFLATMSHEIRTPMNGVLGMMEVLERSPLDAQQRQVLGVVRESASALLTILDDILDFSKIEAGRLELETVPLDLRDLVEGIADLLATRAREKRLPLVTRIALDGAERRIGDPVRLRQVLINLIGNAIKFTAAGHVAVTVRPGDAADAVRFEIEDTGIGLDGEQQARLFHAFTQADPSTTRRFGGSGLGLSICRRLVEMMGGAIGVRSAPGTGACFWFELPLPALGTVAATGELDGVAVLVVDGVEPARVAHGEALAAAGARVVLAADAAAGFEALRRGRHDNTPFDVVLAAHGGGVDGAGLAAALSRMRGLSDTRVLIAAVAEDADLIGRPGVAGVLHTPVRAAVLAGAVARAVGRAAPEALPEPGGQGGASYAAPSLDEARAANAVILVAEDNPVNQAVVSRQLEQLGFACDIVGTGERAWSALGESAYGLLLTDCFMPELDGYELARRIRRDERDSGRRLPIVALTASALAGEAERCFAAGMDDYLSKPVDMASLNRVVTRWLPQALPLRRPGAGTGLSQRAAAGDGPSVILDLDHVAATFGGLEVAAEMLDFFIETTEPLVDGMIGALGIGDAEEARRTAHSAAGAARTAGARELAALCSAIEVAVVGGDLDGARQRVDAVRSAFSRVQAAIRDELPREPVGS